MLQGRIPRSAIRDRVPAPTRTALAIRPRSRQPRIAGPHRPLLATPTPISVSALSSRSSRTGVACCPALAASRGHIPLSSLYSRTVASASLLWRNAEVPPTTAGRACALACLPELRRKHAAGVARGAHRGGGLLHLRLLPLLVDMPTVRRRSFCIACVAAILHWHGCCGCCGGVVPLVRPDLGVARAQLNRLGTGRRTASKDAAASQPAEPHMPTPSCTHSPLQGQGLCAQARVPRLLPGGQGGALHIRGGVRQASSRWRLPCCGCLAAAALLHYATELAQ